MVGRSASIRLGGVAVVERVASREVAIVALYTVRRVLIGEYLLLFPLVQVDNGYFYHLSRSLILSGIFSKMTSRMLGSLKFP